MLPLDFLSTPSLKMPWAKRPSRPAHRRQPADSRPGGSGEAPWSCDGGAQEGEARREKLMNVGEHQLPEVPSDSGPGFSLPSDLDSERVSDPPAPVFFASSF